MVEVELRGQIPLDVAGTLMNLIGAAYPNARVSSANGGLTLMIDDKDRVVDPTVFTRAAEMRQAADEFSVDTYLLEMSGAGAAVTVPHALAVMFSTMAEAMFVDTPDETNYLETVVASPTDPFRRWAVIAARSTERTPHELRMAAEARADRAEAEVVRLSGMLGPLHPGTSKGVEPIVAAVPVAPAGVVAIEAPVDEPVTALTVATDGACSGNPGPAGWSWVDEHGTWRCGGMLRSTNQVGELLGLLNAIVDHAHIPDLTIEIDSTYAMNTYREWMDNAAGRGWTTTAGKPTSNLEVIQDLMTARNVRRDAGLPPVRLVKVKGHAKGKHPLNDAADDRATYASGQVKKHQQVGPWAGDGLVIGAVRV